MTRSQTQDRRVYRFFFAAKARCNHCFDVFLAPCWSVKEEVRRIRFRPQLVNDLSGSQKRSIFRSDVV
ncbi:hypothetical protein Pla123a_45440 [Posidoniimonas polymericola]|uniref:Uncharacterized protein n=1 Tax=Posidoniimonas polymericola TaxID=2528002 RepID=A0A5C5XU66_9BACT|nr:hypothetical protein [Posidoniimonas polymericola]TWT66846.1 hypothetical protein Pla123a_45440 [Posidoniimonas polymericola]